VAKVKEWIFSETNIPQLLCDRISENHPYGCILHIKYLALKSSLKLLLFVHLWLQCSENALNYKKNV